MTSRFRADITIDAGPHTGAIFRSIQVDNAYYTGPDSVQVTYDGVIRVAVSADRVSHLRAGVNSVLRLAKAGDESLQSAGARRTRTRGSAHARRAPSGESSGSSTP